MRGRLVHQTNDFGHLVRRRRSDTGRPGPVMKKVFEAVGHEPLLPAPHAGLRLAGLRHDHIGACPVSAQQHDPGVPDVLLLALRVGDDGL